jgi:hypothetical protein
MFSRRRIVEELPAAAERARARDTPPPAKLLDERFRNHL